MSEELFHYGVKGMKWGVRKDQDSKKQTTSKRASAKKSTTKKTAKEVVESSRELKKLQGQAQARSARLTDITTAGEKKAGLSTGQKVAIGAGIAVVAGLAVYGGYKYSQINPSSINRGDFIGKYMMRSEVDSLRPLTKGQFRRLNAKDTVMPKGTVFSRLTSNPDELFKGKTYVVHTPEDLDRYTAVFADIVRDRSGIDDLYVSKMSSSNSIRMPSPKARVQALIDLVEENPSLRETVARMNPRFMMQKDIDINNLSSNDIAIGAYKSFTQTFHGDSELNTAYLNKIKSMGYNAMIDDFDAGKLGDSPMILFGNDNDITGRTSTLLTQGEQLAAANRLLDVRKGGVLK